MPSQVNLGQNNATTMGAILLRAKSTDPADNPAGLRTVMGFPIPNWQRQIVWTDEQRIRFIESVWKGIPLGTYTFNQTTFMSPLDGLLVDGQQRLYAIDRYIRNCFPVFGYTWSETTILDKRLFSNIAFNCYVTDSQDEEYLKGYYNLMNFSGTAHKESERA